MSMTTSKRRVLLLVPYFNKEGVGEDYSNYKWIEGIANRYDTTILTIARPGCVDRIPDAHAELVEFQDSSIHLSLVKKYHAYAVFSQQVCPNYLRYYREARKWILQ